MGKRLFDIACAATALALLAPLLLALALWVRLDSPGPVLFRQQRVGRDSRPFAILKFRTMQVNAEAAGLQITVGQDPRITRAGSWLRRSKLDELPQLLNVLRGDMSMVGPRPHAIAHNDEYRKLITAYMMRHKVKPGITGWAQIHGHRGPTETVDKMRTRIDYDLEYLRKWSLRLDLEILVRTITTVLFDKHAF